MRSPLGDWPSFHWNTPEFLLRLHLGAILPVLRAEVTHLDFKDWETEHVCST